MCIGRLHFSRPNGYYISNLFCGVYSMLYNFESHCFRLFYYMVRDKTTAEFGFTLYMNLFVSVSNN